MKKLAMIGSLCLACGLLGSPAWGHKDCGGGHLLGVWNNAATYVWYRCRNDVGFSDFENYPKYRGQGGRLSAGQTAECCDYVDIGVEIDGKIGAPWGGGVQDYRCEHPESTETVFRIGQNGLGSDYWDFFVAPYCQGL